MGQIDNRLALLDKENRALKTQLEQAHKSRIPSKALNTLFEHGKMIALFVKNDKRLTVTEISDSISILGYTPEEFLSGKIGWKEVIYPADMRSLLRQASMGIRKSDKNVEHDHRIIAKSGETVWMFCNIVPEYDAERRIIGFFCIIIDVSERKNAQIELARNNEVLEFLVKERTEELGKANSELKSANDELQVSNEELNQYHTRLEEMVEEKTSEVLDQKQHLEKLSGSQAALIKALQILQSPADMHQALYESIAEIGKFTKVCRIHVFEVMPDGKIINLKMEWCNEGVEPVFDSLQNIPATIALPWFDLYEAGIHVCASDNSQLTPELRKILTECGVKSVVAFPLLADEVNHGFVFFDDCIGNREWSDHEVDLLQSLSKILTAAICRFHVEQKLAMEHNRLQAIGDNFPGGALFRWEINKETKEMRYAYLSNSWTNITGLDIQKSLDDITYTLSCVLPEDVDCLKNYIIDCKEELDNVNFDIRILHPSGEIRWLKIGAHPHYISDTHLVFDGFMLDVTARKEVEAELSDYREKLEFLVKERTEALDVTNEELHTSNEELCSTNEILRRYQTKLELMVEEKTAEVIKHQTYLENLNSRQAILIKVLQILQTAENLPKAMNEAIAEIGKYAGVSRVHVFEKNFHENTFSNTMEWCNEGIEPVIGLLQNIDSEVAPWFDMFEDGKLVCTFNDDNMESYSKAINEIMIASNVKSIVVFPLSLGDVHYGFVDFNECNASRIWNEDEVELLKNLSQIISATHHRHRAEHELINERNRLQAIGDHFPDGALFRFEINPHKLDEMRFSYLSATWEDVMGIPIKDTMADISVLFNSISPEFLVPQMKKIERCTLSLQHFFDEYKRKPIHGEEPQWIQVSSYPKMVTENKIIFDGFAVDITARKQAEHALIMERDRLRTIGDNFPNGALFRREINLETGVMRYTYISKKWTKITGLDTQKSLDDIIYAHSTILPEDLKLLTTKIDESKEKFETLHAEIRFRLPSGEIRWVQIASHPHRNGAKIIIYDGFVLDVTERKKVETELNKYREELESLVKERTEKLEISNEELKSSNKLLRKYQMKLEVMVEEKTAEILGQKKHLEKLSQRQAVLINVLKVAQSTENLTQTIDNMLAEIGNYTGVSRVYVFEKSPDETVVNCTNEWLNEGISSIIDQYQNRPVDIVKPWFEKFDWDEIVNVYDVGALPPRILKDFNLKGVKSLVDLPLTANGAHYGFVGLEECITNRVWDEHEVEVLKSISQILSGTRLRYQSEIALRQSHQTMRTVLDDISAYIYVIDLKTSKILFANDRLKKLAGKEIEGYECWKVMQKSQNDLCEFCPKKHLFGTDSFPTDIYHWERYNELFERYLAYDLMVVEWIDGRMVQLVTAIDITERKKAETALIQAKEKAEESDKLKSAFLANMSHEILTPLNGIVGFLDVITSDDLDPQQKQEYVSIINSSAQQLTHLINDIIDVARIQSKQLNILPVPVNLNKMMKEMFLIFEKQLKNSNKEHLVLMLDDSGFINNCTPVVDPSRLRQVLNILIGNAIKFTEKGFVCFGYRQSAPDKLEFMVKDTGIGIEPLQQDIIFECFRQLETESTRFYGGTGLGLSIAKNLINIMGGEIWVESTIEIGSTFYFTILYQSE